jgi:hypothetical protein
MTLSRRLRIGVNVTLSSIYRPALSGLLGEKVNSRVMFSPQGEQMCRSIIERFPGTQEEVEAGRLLTSRPANERREPTV